MIVSPRRGGEIVSDGGVIAYPTETVWGLGGDPFRKEVAERIFQIKGRPREKSFILLVPSIDVVVELVGEITEEEKMVMEKYWPGPLTIIFPVKRAYIKILGETIALRLSPHPVVKEIFAAFKGPLISTSANFSGGSPARDMEEIRRLFEDKVDAVVEGESWGEKPSTIIDIRKKRVIREGSIPTEELLSLLR